MDITQSQLLAEQLFHHSQRDLTGLYNRKTDLLFRWGGEEFLLLCPDTAQDTALNLIKRLLKQPSQHPFLTEDNRAVFMTASAGISGYPHHGSCISDLVKNADSAMYQAKAEGKDKVCISA